MLYANAAEASRILNRGYLRSRSERFFSGVGSTEIFILSSQLKSSTCRATTSGGLCSCLFQSQTSNAGTLAGWNCRMVPTVKWIMDVMMSSVQQRAWHHLVPSSGFGLVWFLAARLRQNRLNFYLFILFLMKERKHAEARWIHTKVMSADGFGCGGFRDPGVWGCQVPCGTQVCAHGHQQQVVITITTSFTLARCKVVSRSWQSNRSWCLILQRAPVHQPGDGPSCCPATLPRLRLIFAVRPSFSC